MWGQAYPQTQTRRVISRPPVTERRAAMQQQKTLEGLIAVVQRIALGHKLNMKDFCQMISTQIYFRDLHTSCLHPFIAPNRLLYTASSSALNSEENKMACEIWIKISFDVTTSWNEYIHSYTQPADAWSIPYFFKAKL